VNRRERLAHPRDEIPSIKLKLGFVIAAAVAVTVFVFWVGLKLGLWPSVSGVIAAIVAMTLVWFLSRGMTSPVREMAAAASEMA
jgi:putative flippase GtrA